MDFGAERVPVRACGPDALWIAFLALAYFLYDLIGEKHRAALADAEPASAAIMGEIDARVRIGSRGGEVYRMRAPSTPRLILDLRTLRKG